MSKAINVRDFKKRIKIAMVDAFDNKCQICGTKEIPEFYEFHHINPATKSFAISSSNTKSTAAYAEEALKCVMVCPNCHRRIELGIEKNVPESRFDKERFLSKLEELKAPEKNHCVDCGKEIPSRNTRCKDCYDKIKLKASKIPTRDELKELIGTTSFVQIGKMYGISDNAIRKWCKKYDLLPTT